MQHKAEGILEMATWPALLSGRARAFRVEGHRFPPLSAATLSLANPRTAAHPSMCLAAVRSEFAISHRTLATTSGNGQSSSNTPKSSYTAWIVGAGLLTFGAAYYWLRSDLGKQKRGTLGLEPLPEDTFVVFVLGGPGAGKGTQCANLVRDYGFVHLSAGDLLREERQRPGSPYGELINNIIKEGQIVPMEITISLLHQAMKKSGAKRFLIDGFPRAVDQSDKFEEEVCQGKLVLYFECPEEELLKRLLKRGETSGRVDDNIESIKKRFQVFKSTSYPVIESFARRGKVASISCLNTVDGVYQDTRKVIDQHFPPQK